MNIEPFQLERWLNNPKAFDLGGAGIVKLQLKDLTDKLDPELFMAYGLTKGSEELRHGVAGLYDGIDPRQVLITSGTAEANLLALYRLLEPGDEFVALTPTYMQCIGFARGLGAAVKYCPLIRDTNYSLDLSQLKRQVNSKTKIILCVNPNNPTGSIYSDRDMRDICAVAESVGAWVLCDGALRGLEMDNAWSSTPVTLYERGIATGSLSKVGLTGIRIGWMIAQPGFIEECWTYKDYTTLCHTGIGEHLAIIALRRENMARYVERARGMARAQSAILGEWIRENSDLVDWVPPLAGHTAFVRYRPDISSVEFCDRLLKEEQVLVSPGDFFDTPRHLRVRYSCGFDELKEGLKRMGALFRRITSGK